MQSSNEDDGQNSSSWFYCQALFSNSSDCFHLWKNTSKYIFFLYPHSPAACKYEFFLKHVFLQKFKGYPLLFSAPKDSNDFSYCPFMKIVLPYPPLPPPPPPVDSILMYVPLKITKPETTRDAFMQGFILFYFIFYYCLHNNKPVEQQSDPAHAT